MKLLDCTLRDGGYYTNWDFDHNLVETYIESFNHLPVDYIEIGYRSNPLRGYLGEFFYCPVYLMESIKNQTNKKLAIILNEKDVASSDAKKLLIPCKDYIELIRIAVNPDNFERALKLGEEIKKLGFEVSFNLMYMSEWKNNSKIINSLPKINGIVDYLYLVDSFGGVYPEDVKNTMQIVRNKTTAKIGFHGHNNLELALANSLTAIENGIDIVDGTITGMGRGAGNLKMELLLTVLQAKETIDFDFNWFSKVIDPFREMQKNYEWGTNLPYMFSGANSIPQKQVMEWVSKRYYSFNSIIRALTNRSRGVKDNQRLDTFDFSTIDSFKSALIVGGGPNAVHHSNALNLFLKNHPEIALIHASSKNAMSFQNVDNDQYFCLVGNEGHRLEKVFNSVNEIKGKCILPPYPREMGTYIPSALEDQSFELEKVDFTNRYTDTHTTLALQTAINLGVDQIYFSGYDGYSGDNIKQKDQELFIENDLLFEDCKKVLGDSLISLTPTKYNKLTQSTVYSYL